jgi:Spy/CpxP family protein refolding chaperone
MKTKLVLIAAFVLAGILSSTSIFAQADCKNKHGENMKQGCLMDELTPEQQKKIETIKAESDKKVVQYKADLKIKKAELDKLSIAETPSKKDIDAKIDEISVLKASIQKEKVGCRLLIREQLTPEQRVKFDAHHANKDGKMGGHGDKMNYGKCDHSMNNEGKGQMNHEGCKGQSNHEGCKGQKTQDN